MYHPVMCYISKFVVIPPVQNIHVSNLYELHDLHKSFSHSSSSTVLFIAPYENRHAEYINKQHHKTGKSLLTQFAQSHYSLNVAFTSKNIHKMHNKLSHYTQQQL